MASQTKPRAPAQHKKKRKDAGPDKHGLSLGDSMEQSQEALPPKRRHPRNRSRQQAQDEVPPVSYSETLFWSCVDVSDKVASSHLCSCFLQSQLRM